MGGSTILSPNYVIIPSSAFICFGVLFLFIFDILVTHVRSGVQVTTILFLQDFHCKRLVKKYTGGVGVWAGRNREGLGHEVLSLVQRVGRTIFSYP